MTVDLAYLPAWYGKDGDYVLLSNDPPDDFLMSLPQEIRPKIICLNSQCLKAPSSTFPSMNVSPWGMTQQCLRMFKDFRDRFIPEMIIPEWNDTYFELLGRQTAAACLDEMKKHLCNRQLPETPVFCSNIEDIETFLATRPEGNYVLKAPYSSSGRGVYWLKGCKELALEDTNWIRGIIRRQKAVSIEAALDKQIDFAIELVSDGKGNVKYEGISIFQTNEKGAYKGNLLLSQERLLGILEEYVNREALKNLLEVTVKAVRTVYGYSYAGYIGVDMLIYKTDNGFEIHPCIEVNLRYTMGMIALRLFDRLLDSKASACMNIIYNEGSALDRHKEMKSTHPLILKDGKISKGYLSLCPVSEETRYVACIIAE